MLLDDRDERPGVKFKDADLIGIPLRVTVGPQGARARRVELEGARADKARGECRSPTPPRASPAHGARGARDERLSSLLRRAAARADAQRG